jgi:hypothetical protein
VLIAPEYALPLAASERFGLASGKPSLTAKTRVGVFCDEGPGQDRGKWRAAAGTAPGCVIRSYETASGRLDFCNGDPVNFTDPDGRAGDAPSSTSTTSTNSPFTVTVNGAQANIPGGGLLNSLGVQHQWINTNTGLSGGMGNQQGVPGENGQTSPDLPFSPTQVVDHTGRTPSTTQTYTGLDPTTVDLYLQQGQPTGPWIPKVNDCNTWTEKVIDNSTPKVRGVDYSDTIEGEFPHQDFSGLPADKKTVIYPDGSVHVVDDPKDQKETQKKEDKKCP